MLDFSMTQMLMGLGLLYVIVAVMLGVLGGGRWVAMFVGATPLLFLAPVALYSAHCGECGHGLWIGPVIWLFTAFCIAGSRRRNTEAEKPKPSQTPPGS
jgi:hypothetical protein